MVQDERGFRGGLFLDRIQALKFAKSENGGSSPAVIMMKEPFELDMRAVRGNSLRNASMPRRRHAVAIDRPRGILLGAVRPPQRRLRDGFLS